MARRPGLPPAPPAPGRLEARLACRRFEMAGGVRCAALRSLEGGRPAALAAGQELCVSYGAMTTADVFLSFGFVPEEAAAAGQAAGIGPLAPATP